MKKITFFIQQMYGSGGTERMLTLIANKLSEDYEVMIVSLFKTKSKPFYEINDKIKKIYMFDIERDKKYFWRILSCIKEFLKDEPMDVFVCTGMGMVIPTIFMSKNTKYIAWEHFNCTRGKFGSLRWLSRKIASKYANKIVLLTQKDMNLYQKKFKPQAELVQIYNPTQELNIKSEYDLTNKKILSSGRLCYQKGFDMLIEIAEKVFAKHPDWQWDIYGDGPDKEKIEKLILHKNLIGKVNLMGRTDKMKELYSDYSMFVMTSRFEGFAMVNIEAHYAKLPIVSFNCNCGPDEIIQDGVNGYLIDCFDVDEMAEKINYLIENPDIRKNMSEMTMLDKEKLKMEKVIEKWKEIL